MKDRYRRLRATDSGPAPFWTRIPDIAHYPLRGVAGWTTAALSLCGLLKLLPVIGFVTAIMLFVAIYVYAFEILQASANGRLSPPQYGYYSDVWLVVRYLLLSLVQGLVVILISVYTHSPPLILLAIAIVVLIAPASMIVLVLERSLLSALNPLYVLDIVIRIGWQYLAAYGLLFVIAGSTMTATLWASKYLPQLLIPVATTLAASWSTFASCHLLGYLVYQHHERLGFKPETGNVDTVTDADPDQYLLNEAEEQVREGQPEAALQILRSAVRSRPVSLAVHELYQRLLRQRGPCSELDEHARQYLIRLLDEKQERNALNLLRQVLAQQPERLPLDESHAMHLLELSRRTSQLQLTLDLLQAMLRTWPRAPDTAQRALEAGLLLAERYGRDDEARALLQQALTSSNNEQQHAKIQAALQALG